MRFNRHYDPDRHGIWCWYCHGGLTGENATIDHIVPLSKGGSNHWYNLAWVCSRCNGLKANLSLEEFRPLLSRITGFHEFAFERSDLVRKWFEELGPNAYAYLPKMNRFAHVQLHFVGHALSTVVPTEQSRPERRLYVPIGELCNKNES